MTKAVPPKLHVIPDHDRCTTIPTSQQPSMLPQPHLIKDDMNAVLDITTGEMLEYRHLIKGPDKVLWKKVLANDLGRLA